MARFQIGGPAAPTDLVDRKKEIEYLMTKMTTRDINYNVAVLGYRRIGKSSILMKLYDNLSKKKHIIPVYFDVQKNMAEPRIFFEQLQKSIFDAYLMKLTRGGKAKTNAIRMAGDLIAKITGAVKDKKISNIGVSITPEGVIAPTVHFADKKPDYASLFHSVFGTLPILAEKNNLKFVVILDEFQDLVKFRRYNGLKYILSMFRATIQERGKDVSYVISGSRVHMYAEILDSGKSPLFSHFEKLTVYGMEEKYSVELFTKYLKARGLTVAENTATEAYEIVGGNPFYLMALAEAYNQKEALQDTYVRILTGTIGSLKNYVDYVLSEDLGNVTGGPVLPTILRILAVSDGLTVAEISKRTRIKYTSLPFHMKNLKNSDLVIQEEGRYKIRDKIVKDYLVFEVNGSA